MIAHGDREFPPRQGWVNIVASSEAEFRRKLLKWLQMADIVSKSQRSRMMSAVKGRGNKTTEMALRRLFRSSHVTGWRSNLSSLPGSPDFAFRTRRTVVFVDGCFWHGCRSCTRNLTPRANSEFWQQKVLSNRTRDHRVDRQLRSLGWKVVRVWEHELKVAPEKAVDRVRHAIELVEQGNKLPV